jgi:DNA modification methylase
MVEYTSIKIAELKPYERNAKKHDKKQIALIANSIKEFGFDSPIIVDKDNVIIAGHGRLEGAKLLGIKEVPVIRKENLTEEQVKAYRLADNKIAESEWDMGLDIEELKGLSDEMFDLTGFDKDLILEPDAKDDEVPEIPEEPKSKLGDLYELGEHRVLCGDSTSKEDIDVLTLGKIGKIVFTSPPYNMDAGMYENYKDDLKRNEYIQFNIDTINNWKRCLKGFLFWNISYNKNARDDFIEIMYRAIKETKLKFLELIVWNKKTAMPITSNKMMTRQYEDIFLLGDDDSIKEDLEMFSIFSNYSKAIFNIKTRKYLRNYWEIPVNKVQLDNHKACYPVQLPSRAITIMTEENDIVLDPFLGSGSTLIACEKFNRKCYGTDLDPKYIDVIVQRYVDYTGNENIIKNGKPIIWNKK